MKKLSIIFLSIFAISFAGCSGNVANGKHELEQDTVVTRQDSIQAADSAPPRDSTMADSTSNAPKMPGE